MNLVQINNRIAEAFVSELGQQVNTIYTTIDGKMFIRLKEAKSHALLTIPGLILTWDFPVNDEQYNEIKRTCAISIFNGELPIDFLGAENDYEGFNMHIAYLNNENIPTSAADLVKLENIYGIKPKMDFDSSLILRNAIVTPDGTVLVSKYRHDFVSHVDKVTGKRYFVDGGSSYMRTSTNGDEINISVYDDGDFNKRRYYLHWGVNTYKNGRPRKQTKWTRICELETDHIKAILEHAHVIDAVYKDTMIKELEKRCQ